MIFKKIIYLNIFFSIILINMQFIFDNAKDQLDLVAQKKNNYKL